MKLIKLDNKKVNKVKSLNEFSVEQEDILTYTKNFYILEKDNNFHLTNEDVTLKQLQNYMNLRDYIAYTLDSEEAKKMIVSDEEEKTKTTKKKTSKKPKTTKKKETKETKKSDK